MNFNIILKDFIGKMSLILSACVFILFFVEIVIRLFFPTPMVINNIGPFRFVTNPKIIYEFIPGTLIDSSIINHQGFKDMDFIREKPRNTIRIAMLGDSITQGMNIPIGKTFSDQLENLLNKRTVEKYSNLRYEVMNFGVGGYNLEAEVETLKTKALDYSPDIVVLNFFHNDNEPVPGMSFIANNEINENQRMRIFKKYYSSRNTIWRFAKRNVLYKSKLYLFLIDRIRNFNRDRVNMLLFFRNNYNSIASGDDNFYEELIEIEKLRKKFGFKFLICLHPHLLTGEHPNNFKFEKVAKLFNLPTFHMSDYYKKETVTADSIQMNKTETCHPNELGHSIIARAIFYELRKNGFIDNKL